MVLNTALYLWFENLQIQVQGLLLHFQQREKLTADAWKAVQILCPLALAQELQLEGQNLTAIKANAEKTTFLET